MTTDGGKTWALNVIPTEAEAGFDVRIPPTVPLDEFEARMKEWCDSSPSLPIRHFVFPVSYTCVLGLLTSCVRCVRCVRCRTKEEGVHYEFVVKTPQHSVTSVDPAENEWWRVFSETTQKLGLGIETEIFPAGAPLHDFFRVSCVSCVCLVCVCGMLIALKRQQPRTAGT
jgi:aminoacylase